MKDLTTEELEVMLCSTGYLPPRNEEELSFFNEMYKDYKPRIKNRHVDVEMILNGGCHIITDYRFYKNPHDTESTKVAEDIKHEYFMAARNFDKLPKEILEKMKKQHKLNKEDE